MNGARLAGRQLFYENRAFWRNPAAAFFTIFFPLMFLFLFPTIFGEGEVRYFGRTTSATTFYVPAIGVFSIITAAYTNLAMGLTFARDEGVLKRKRGTPMPPWAFVAGKVVHSILVAIVLIVVVVLAGALFFDVDVPTNTAPAFLLTVMVGALTFSSLALAITGVVPNADAAPAVINFSIFPLLFISDVFIPVREAPEWLKTIAEIFPVYHFSQSMLSAFDPFETGSGLEWSHLGVLLAWAVAGLLLARRFFSWEPRV